MKQIWTQGAKDMSNTISTSPSSLCLRLLVGLVLSASCLQAQTDSSPAKQLKSPRGYVCYRTDSPLTIDGRLNESVWEPIAWTDYFVDIEGDSKPRPRFNTRAKMLWDSQYFYIGVVLEEPHVWGTLVEHDSVIFHDNDFEVFIDPDGDNHEYYEFEINALNTGWDLFLPRPYMDGGKADNSWEIPGLKTAIDVRGTLNDPADIDHSWSVEIAIPWDVLREFAHRPSPPKPGDQWRVNFSRVEWHHEIDQGKYRRVPNTREDNWVWSPQGIINMHRPDHWGFVQFSDRKVGVDKFRPDPSLPARRLLMRVYARQKDFHKTHQRYASNWAEMGVSIPSGLSAPKLSSTADGFIATVEAPHPDGTRKQLRVRQDSKLWWIE